MRKNKSKSRNKNHPEMRSDEVFYGNVSDELEGNMGTLPSISIHMSRSTKSEYQEIGFKTKRLGNIAYDSSGKIIKYMRPVFVGRKEWKENEKKCRKENKN